MNKPELKYINEKAYDWHEIEEWIAIKYKKSVRDWSNKFTEVYNPDVEYEDFWHTIIDKHTIHNGCYFNLDLDPAFYAKDFEKEIVKLLAEEFSATELYCWASW